MSLGWQRTGGVHAMADASWGDRNLIGILIMMNGGAIVTDTKKIGPADSSAEVEGTASSKCAEYLEHVHDIARGMGVASDAPTVVGTDKVPRRAIHSVAQFSASRSPTPHRSSRAARRRTRRCRWART